MNPLVSVVIPAYKSEYIREAIKSVVSQTYDDIEVIVCDDSAGDVIESVLKEEAASINLRYFRNEKQLGGRENHLKCLSLAGGKYIKFLHDDDVLHPDCIARLVSAMEADNTLALASSKRHLIDSKGQLLPDILATTFPFKEDVVLDGPSVVTFLADHTVNFIGEPSCVLCRRADLVTLGEDFSSLNGRVISWVGDLAMYANLLQRGNLALISQALSFFRVSREQFSQLGRDKPGIGNQGHADFRNSIRELGWYRDTQDSKCVGVAPLFGLVSQRFKQVNLLESMHRAKTTAPAEIVTWMEARRLAPFQADLITPHMEKLSEGSIQIIVVDREDAPEAVSQTLDSIQAFSYHSKLQVHVLAESPTPGLENRCRSFQFTRGELAKSLNQSLAVSSAEWFVVVEAGAELIPSGLLIAAMELANDPECRAICFDEIYRQQDGCLGAAFRPSFNLDYLISFPAGLSKHWLFRRSVVLEADGFDTALDAALELDLILRLVNVGGLAGWGHISEPLVITQSPALANIEEEKLAITRHLHARG
ncbi:MAG: glycosyltransferase, partial [Pseudomonas sp.]